MRCEKNSCIILVCKYVVGLPFTLEKITKLLEVYCTMMFKKGELIKDVYEVEEVFEGGMAVVYIVKNQLTHEKFAMKYLNEVNLESVKRFKREMKLLHKFNSKRIIPILKTEENGNEFYFMMPVAEKSLMDDLNELSIEKVYNIFISVCHGIYEMHNINGIGKQSIIHRDIKPQNVLFYNNTYVISDFGLAVDVTRDTEKLTSLSSVMGTDGYIAPECRQNGSIVADERSDIYQLGKLLYHMITKKWPTDEITDYSMIPPGITQILKKSVSDNPHDRQQTVQELVDEINSFIYQKDISIFLNKTIPLKNKNQQEIIDMMIKLQGLDKALIDAESEKIFERISHSSGNIFHEIAQNADDANATNIEILIKDNTLLISNNGDAFTKDDIISLCGVTARKSQLNKIGRFGIGFKRIFAMSKQVDLYSGSFFVKIKNFIELSNLEEGYEFLANSGDTHFVAHLSDEGLTEITASLVALNYQNFVFLNNIESIRVRCDGKILFDYTKVYKIRDKKVGNKQQIISCYDQVQLTDRISNNSCELIIFKTQDHKELEKKEFIQIAFEISANNIITSVQSPRLYSFLPLDIRLKYGFIFSANFEVLQNRSSIKFDENKEILAMLFKGIYDSFIVLTELKFIIDYTIFNENIVRTDETLEKYVNEEMKKVIGEVYSKERVWLDTDHEYRLASELIKCEASMEWKNLYTCNEIFPDEEIYWIESKTEDYLNKISRSYNYSEGPVLASVTFKEFRKKEQLEYLSAFEDKIYYRDDVWLVSFYKMLFENDYLLPSLTFKLFKTVDKSFEAIKTEFNSQYMYSGKDSLIPDDVSLVSYIDTEIFKKMGIGKHVAAIPEYTYSFYLDDILKESKKEYISDNKKLLHGKYFPIVKMLIAHYEIMKQNKLINNSVKLSLQKELPIICWKINTNDKGELEKYYVYLGSEDTMMIANENNSFEELYVNKQPISYSKCNINILNAEHKYYIVDVKLYRSKLEPQEFEMFMDILAQIGVNRSIVNDSSVKFYNYDFKLSQNKQALANILTPQQYHYEKNLFMPRIIFIELILLEINLEKSKALWELICEKHQELFANEVYFEYEYNRQHKRIPLENELLNILTNNIWIFNKNNVLSKASQISASDLEFNGYVKNEKVCRLLGISTENDSNALKEIRKLAYSLSAEEQGTLVEYLIKLKS